MIVGEEADEEDDGGQRGETSYDSDSDHPVRACSTGVSNPQSLLQQPQMGIVQNWMGN